MNIINVIKMIKIMNIIIMMIIIVTTGRRTGVGEVARGRAAGGGRGLQNSYWDLTISSPIIITIMIII